MSERALTVYLATGEIRSGGWCEKCRLPSLDETDIYVLSAEGAQAGVTQAGTFSQCTDHDDARPREDLSG